VHSHTPGAPGVSAKCPSGRREQADGIKEKDT
jgi:hypothetical protein